MLDSPRRGGTPARLGPPKLAPIPRRPHHARRHQTYLLDLTEAHSTGSSVDETSFYGALENLLTAVGADLKPRVKCVLTLANRGAGIPDGGLFTPDQFQRALPGAPLLGQLPSRGVLEAKGPDADLSAVARSEQVERYCRHYGQVLVTNYR